MEARARSYRAALRAGTSSGRLSTSPAERACFGRVAKHEGFLHLPYVNAFVLAVVEGITEFLPISSTGHLILVEEYFPLGDGPGSRFAHAYHVLIQLPAIGAVAVYFWRRLWPFSGDDEQRRRTLALWRNVIVAFLPAAAIGFVFHDVIDEVLMFELPVAIALVVGGALLIVLERLRFAVKYDTVDRVTWRTSLSIGFIQCLAMFPGTSRSAATIIGAMLLGTSRAAAAEFSFFLAIPTMLGASVLTIAKNGLAFTAHEWSIIALGSAVSFLTAYGTVAFLMRFIQRHDFTLFGVYRIVLGGIVLVAYFV